MSKNMFVLTNTIYRTLFRVEVLYISLHSDNTNNTLLHISTLFYSEVFRVPHAIDIIR